MAHFDRAYWEEHWAPRSRFVAQSLPANPYLQHETAGLHPATVLDAGCGAGAEALWLAEQGWQVTAADISANVLASAQARATTAGLDKNIEWVKADLSRWEPARTWDLVVTSYAHPSTGQLTFYQRIASWVALGGTLLIVGHLHDSAHHGHDHPDEAMATLKGVTKLFTAPEWKINASYENTRTVHPGGSPVQLRDVIVSARRLQ